jgi:cytochrome c556
MNATNLNKLIAATVLVACTSLFAADTSPTKQDSPSAAKSAAPADVKRDMEKFNAQRDAMLADRQALVNQLKTATDEQRKVILEKMKELGDAQRELSKQIREDLRKLRQGQGASGR